jgi:hypothetical protein
MLRTRSPHARVDASKAAANARPSSRERRPTCRDTEHDMSIRFAFLPAMAAALLILAAGGTAVAQAPRVEKLEIVEAGFYSAQTTGTSVAPATATGTNTRIADVEFFRESVKDTARVGAQFGVRFRSTGEPRGGVVTLRSVWKIPAPGIKNPKTGNIYRESSVSFAHLIGTSQVRGYSFDEPWEVVRGTWTLQIWQGEEKLLERDFTIQ